MDEREADDIPAIPAASEEPMEDRGEPVALMEPLLLGESSRHRAALIDL